VNHGAKSNDKTEIQKYGLCDTVVIKLLKMGNDSPKEIKKRTICGKCNKRLHGDSFQCISVNNDSFVCSLFPKFVKLINCLMKNVIHTWKPVYYNPTF
jgi:hypothetical protein